MDQREFIDMIRACRRKLNLAGFLKMLVFALSVGAGAGVILQAISFVMPLYYVNAYTGIALMLAVLSAIIVSLIRRGSMEDAALVMDSFGFQERIVTAYEHLKDGGTVLELQRKDAMEQLKRYKDRIRIPLWPDWKRTALSAALIILMFGLVLAPSRMKDRARELHQIQAEAGAKEKEIKEVLEELEQLAEQEELTPEQLEALQEMMESLQSSMAEYRQVSSQEALQAAGEKLTFKYGNMSGRMFDMARNIRNGAAVSPISAESMQAMADRLREMSGNLSAANSLASSQGQDSDGQSKSGTGDGHGGVQGDSQSGTGDGQIGGQGGQGDGQGDGHDGQSGGHDGQSGGQGGQGDGQGSQGDGQGGGSGSGRGTGSTDTSRDYVSIPNAVADSGNLTGNAGNHNNSEYFLDQNGLSWEGVHESYEAVIGSYEQNAYEGIAAGKYPSSMENVIKEYFSSFH